MTPCIVCGRPCSGPRCVEHERERQRRRNLDRAGLYDAEHRALRKQWEPRVKTGTVRCARCDGLIAPTDEWHLDHVDRVTGKRHPSHARHNSGARTNVARR